MSVDELRDIFHPWYISLPLVKYQHLSIVPIQLLSPSSMLAMLILVLKEIKQDLVPMFQCTCCKNVWIILLVTMYHFEHTDHDTGVDFLFQNLLSLYLHDFNQCYNDFHIQIIVNFFYSDNDVSLNLFQPSKLNLFQLYA